jgi:DNA primase
MEKKRNLLNLATNYHKALPPRIRWYLNKRGIRDVLIDFHLLGWNGRRITIPIFNYEGEAAFFKLAKDPADRSSSPKMMATPGSYVEVYGWEEIKRRPNYVIICEGEFDRLVLEGKGFVAVTSTGGARTFREEWAEKFKDIPQVFICFDNDEAGRRGAERVGQMISQAKLVELPEEVGEGGDVTDFFVRLGKKRKDFLKLLEEAKPAPPKPKLYSPDYMDRFPKSMTSLNHRVAQIKADLLIERVVSRYVRLRISGNTLLGLCPFHEDHNPSLTVYPKSSAFHCYGCGRHGDVITFLMAMEHLTFGQALDALDRLRGRYDQRPQPEH